MALGKQVLIAYQMITIRRVGEEIETHTYILTFNESTILKEVKLGYSLKKGCIVYPYTLEVLYMSKIWIPQRAAGDVWHVEGLAKGTQTTWSKIVLMKPNAETAKKTILYFQDIVVLNCLGEGFLLVSVVYKLLANIYRLLSPWLAANEGRVSHVLSHVVWLKKKEDFPISRSSKLANQTRLSHI